MRSSSIFCISFVLFMSFVLALTNTCQLLYLIHLISQVPNEAYQYMVLFCTRKFGTCWLYIHIKSWSKLLLLRIFLVESHLLSAFHLLLASCVLLVLSEIHHKRAPQVSYCMFVLFDMMIISFIDQFLVKVSVAQPICGLSSFTISFQSAACISCGACSV